jgi:hypothetical protein
MRPIALSDSQLDIVLNASRPLPPDRRGEFLEAVARALHGQPIGDGTVFKVCGEQQAKLFDPPDLSTGRMPTAGKYA